MHSTQYNRAWLVHSIMAEGFERLLLKIFLAEKKPQIPELVENAAAEDSITPNVIDECIFLANNYNKYKASVREGSLGKQLSFGLSI